jgi:hypothetical protein
MRKIIEDKKAILATVVLKLVIALLCLLILIGLGYELYNMFIKSSEREQAEETLNQIENKINNLEQGEVGKQLILAPEGWILLQGKESKELCICNYEDLFRKEQKHLVCAEQGYCKRLDFEAEFFEFCRGNNVNYGTEKKCVYFEELPLELSLIIKQEKVHIMTEENFIHQSYLDNLLNYKKDSDSDSVNELLLSYIDNQDSNIEDNLKQSLEKYFNNLNLGSLFKINKDEFRWIFMLSEGTLEETLGKQANVVIRFDNFDKEIKISKRTINPGEISEFDEIINVPGFEFMYKEKNYMIRLTYYKDKGYASGDEYLF